ncbi:MAG TPA: ABC transporter ATP-binding protein, partial [Sphingomicrobium sp.]|nr:ABC transporter ATP-binding protein [Sphingomicrobium sp.]
EPLGALDRQLREQMQFEIKRLQNALGITVIYVTHDQEEALVLSDRIAVFNGGRIEQIGTGRELYDNPATLFVGRFIGESTVLRGASEASGNDTIMTIGSDRVVAHGRLAGDARPVLLLRPERVALKRAGADIVTGENRLSGTIAEAIYLGSGSKYEVRLNDGTIAVVRSPLGVSDLAIGDSVDIAFMPADLILLPDDASADVTLT